MGKNDLFIIIGIVLIAIVVMRYLPGLTGAPVFDQTSQLFGDIKVWIADKFDTQAITVNPVNLAPGATGRVTTGIYIPCPTNPLTGTDEQVRTGSLEVQFSQGSSVLETRLVWGYCPTSGSCSNPMCGQSIGPTVQFTAPNAPGAYQVTYTLRSTQRTIIKTESTTFNVVRSTSTTCTNVDRVSAWELISSVPNGAFQGRTIYKVGDAPACHETTSNEYQTVCDDGYLISGTTLQYQFGSSPQVCVATAQPPASPASTTCVDSDGGKNYNVKGTVSVTSDASCSATGAVTGAVFARFTPLPGASSGASVGICPTASAEDQCKPGSSTVIMELYCASPDATDVSTAEFDCASEGKTCSGGVCMTGTCVPNCVNKCGQPDGCGNLCESCKTAKTYYCQDSQHIQECTPVLGIPVCYPYKTCTAPQTCIAGQAVCSGECIPSIACSVATCGKTISDGCTNIQCPACGGNGTLSFMDTCGQCGGTSLVTYKNETCGPGLICACPGPGTAKCYDSVKNKAFIACSLAGGFPLGAKGSCKKDICTAYGGWIPQSYGSASASITGDFGYILAQDCFDCLPGGLRAMPTDPSSACCSGQFAAGSTLCLAPISAYNFSHVQVTSTPSIESLPLSSVTGSTPETLLKHACISNDDCAESNCKSFDWLVDNKYTTEKDKNNFFDTYAGPAATITGGITGLGLGSIAGFAAGQSLAVGACAIAERIGIAGGPETAVISVGVCRLIVEAPFVLAGGTTGVFVGGTVGDRAVSFFNEIADRHTNIVGVCIPPGDTGGGVCSYFDWLKPVLTPLGAADKSCTVGFIIAFVILLILLRSFAR